MSTDPGHWLIVKPMSAWKQQAETALDEIKAANGGVEPPNLRAAHAVAPLAFGKLIEALHALGAEVDDEMMQLAGMRDIGEVI